MKKVLFLDPDDESFLVQRLVMVKAAQAAGYEVHVAAPDTGHASRLAQHGMIYHKLDLNRGGMNPVADLLPFIRLVVFLAKQRPYILHNISIKPVIYGSIAARLAGLPRVVNLVNGLGYAFDGQGTKGRVIRWVAMMLYRVALSYRHAKVIFQNPDDRALFVDNKLVPQDRTVLIRGSGVNLSKFVPTSSSSREIPNIVFIGRLIKTKGIGELVRAAKILREERVSFKLLVVGEPDPKNPESVSEDELKGWQEEGLIERLGKQSDMPKIYALADLVCLPSYYREGVPLTLIEAAASGKPIVAADSPGTREPVVDGENGYIVPPRDHVQLAAKLKLLLQDANLRAQMGIASQKLAREEFSAEIVQQKLIALYASF